VPFVRYAILLAQGDKGNHYQSLMLGTLLLIGSGLSLAIGVLSDLAKSNRILNEDQLYRIKEQQYGPAVPAATAARQRQEQAPKRPRASSKSD